MSADKLVDSTQLDSDLTSVANAIRAKSGGSGQLAFPSGFVSEIGNIPSGGGGDSIDISGNYYGLHCAKVTAGSNSVSDCLGATKYLLGLAGASNPGPLVAWGQIDATASASRVQNQVFGNVLNTIHQAYSTSGSTGRKMYRWRDGAMQNNAADNTSYDGKIISGLSYWIVWTTGGAPT